MYYSSLTNLSDLNIDEKINVVKKTMFKIKSIPSLLPSKPNKIHAKQEDSSIVGEHRHLCWRSQRNRVTQLQVKGCLYETQNMC
jgi:hypothetical protein